MPDDSNPAVTVPGGRPVSLAQRLGVTPTGLAATGPRPGPRPDPVPRRFPPPPRRPDERDVRVGWGWYGAHGGAGVTTLAAMVPGGVDLGRAWPTDRTMPVVVVARSHARGLRAAQAAAAAAAPGGPAAGQPILGLVVVSDQPGRLPRPLAELGRLAASTYPRLWQVPYLAAWRLTDPGDLPAGDIAVPAELDAVRAGVRAACEEFFDSLRRRPARSPNGRTPRLSPV